MSAASFAANVDFSEVNREGQTTITGEGFRYGQDNDDEYHVNFYINDKFLKQITTNSNGSFSYTTPAKKVKNRDEITVKVLQYYSDSRHWEKSQRVYREQDEDDDHGLVDIRINNLNLRSGQVTVLGSGLKKEFGGHKIEIYINNHYLKSIRSNANGSFSYTTAKNSVEKGDRLKVVVSDYFGFWSDLEKTFVIRKEENKEVIKLGEVSILGQFKVTGNGFINGKNHNHRYRVEIRVAGGVIDYIKTNSDGDFQFTSGVFNGLPGLKVSVRVKDYYGLNKDWQDSAYLK